MLLIEVFLTLKTCNVVLKSSKHESITFPDEFIFASAPHFIGAISSKNAVRKVGIGKRVKNVGRQELFIDLKKRGFKPSAH